MPRKRPHKQYRQTALVSPRRRGDPLVARDPIEVRYSITWNYTRLNEMVQKAYRNKGGASFDGPITVTIHPEDRP